MNSNFKDEVEHMRKGFFLFLTLLLTGSAFAAHKIKSVNFFQKGEISKLIIEVDGPVHAERKAMKQDKQILLDIQNVTADAKVLRGIDTSEFAGSSVYIAGYKKPENNSDIRFAIQLRDNVNSFLEMSDNKIILNIENRFGVMGGKVSDGAKTIEQIVGTSTTTTTETETLGRLHVPKSADILDILENLTLSGPKRYVGKRISINVNNMQVQDLLRIIAETSGFNIIIDDEVKRAKPLTLKLTNLPWDQILDTILGLSKLSAEKHANILTVTTRARAEEDLLQKVAAEKAKVQQEPLVTKIFPISYGKLGDVQKIVEGYLTKERGSVKSDERTNYLIVNDTIEKIERIKKIVEALDTETAQVLIEARIVEINDRDQLNIGLTNGLSLGYEALGSPSRGSESGAFSFSSTGASVGADGSISSAGVLGLAIRSFSRLVNLDFSLELAQQKSHLKIISSPRVVTQNKQTASLTSSETVGLTTSVITTGSSEATPQPTTANADISLEVTPQVTNEGSINLDINIQKADFLSTVDRSRAPDTLTRKVKTNVLVDNGATISIGGLYKTSSQRQENGIPILKDIPIIGWLFKSKYNPLVIKDELMIFITPRIINQEEAGLTGSNLSAIKANSIQ